MKKPVLQIVLAGGAVALAIGIVALTYSFSKRPEEDYARQFFVNGFSNETSAVYSSFEEWDQEVKAWTETRLLSPLTLTSERGEFTVTLMALGVTPDWATFEKELKYFMSESSMLERTLTYFMGRSLNIPLTINTSILEQTLAESGFEQGEKNASFSFNGTELSIVPEELGYGIEQEPLLALLEGSLSSPVLESEWALTLRTQEPEVRTQDLEVLLPKAQALVLRVVQLKDPQTGNVWELSVAEHLDWIKPLEAGHSSGFDWEIDESAFLSYVETTLAPEVEEDPQPVVITETQEGTYAFEGSARFGIEINRMDLRADLFTALELETDQSELVIPLTQTQPSVTVPESLKARGVTNLVGFGYSDFSGSPANRVHNIQTGIAFYNGVFIEQGAEFSFMGLMPEVDASNGFLPELVIKGDETIPEYGGGLCQVSSTMFRAALYSGLPITARKNHSYAVAYYARPFGYGLDATVYDPAPDLKFVNDTPGDLLVQAYTEGTSAYYVFYGTNDGRTVTMDGPYSYDYRSIPPAVTTYTDELAPGERELESYGHTGFTTDWYRTVTYVIPTEEELATDPDLYVSPYASTVSGVAELIHSVYEARPAKYLEGRDAGDEGESVE